jgi:hypothetical protein
LNVHFQFNFATYNLLILVWNHPAFNQFSASDIDIWLLIFVFPKRSEMPNAILSAIFANFLKDVILACLFIIA